MQDSKKSILLISVGSLNFIHGLLHIFQFIQSVLLIGASFDEHGEETFLEELLHSPYLAILWAIVGILTLWVGVKDFIEHYKQNQT